VNHLLDKEEYIQFCLQPSDIAFREFQRMFRESYGFCMPKRPTVLNTLVNANDLNGYTHHTKGSAVDYSELLFLAVAPLIMRIVFTSYQGKDWDAEEHLPILLGMIKSRFCTIKSTTLSYSSVKERLSKPSIATQTIMFLYEAAISCRKMTTLVSSFTKAHESVARSRLGRIEEVELIGKNRCWFTSCCWL